MGEKVSNEVRMTGILPSQGADPIPVGKIPDGGTQVVKSQSAISQTLTIHTVTTLKTFYLSACAVGAQEASGSAHTASMVVTDAGDTTKYVLYKAYAPANGGDSWSMSFMPPLEIPAGWKIKIVSGAALFEVTGFIHGYEA